MKGVLLASAFLGLLLLPGSGAIVPAVTIDPCGATLASNGSLSTNRAPVAASLFRDDMEDLLAWRADGPGSVLVPLTGSPGCHLTVAPVCCDAYRDFTRSIDIRPSVPLSISVMFRGSTTTGQTDTVFEVLQWNGQNLALTITEGVGQNNGVRLVHGDANTEVIATDTHTFYRWTRTNTWYTAVIRVDPASGLAFANVLDTGGNILATSPVIEVGVGNFDTLSTLRFRSVAYDVAVPGPIYDWDTIVITQGAPIARLPLPLSDSFDSLSNWAVSDGSSSIQCGTGAPGCFVRMTPACCGTYRDIERLVNVDPDGAFDASIKFRGSRTTGNLDAVFQFIQSDGATLVITTTEGGSSSNNGFRLVYGNRDGQIVSDTGWFGSWTATNVWYTIRIHTDPVSGTASASVRDASGVLLATSPTLATGVGNFETISTLLLRTISYSDAGSYDWDSLLIEDV